MKPRTLLSITVFMLVAAVILIGASCDNGGGGSGGTGSFTYDGMTYTLTTAIIDTWGANLGLDESGYDVDFTAATSGVDLEVYTGTGNGIYLDLNCTSNSLVAGTYTWSSTRVENSLVVAVVFLDYNLDTDTGTELEGNGGTVTVSVSGDTYTVEFSITLVIGGTVSGSYTGPAKVFNN